MDKSEELIADARLLYRSRKRLFGLNLQTGYEWLRFFANCIAVAITIMNLNSIIFDTNTEAPAYNDEGIKATEIILCSVQSGIAGALLVLWTVNNLKQYLSF